MMLALLASVTLVIPAYAWDFSASGSASSGWKQTTVVPASGDATTSADFSGSSGGVSLKSGHTDGDKSLTLTYTADVDTDGTQSTGSSDTAGSAGLDQTLSLAGSTKVGNCIPVICWKSSKSIPRHSSVQWFSWTPIWLSCPQCDEQDCRIIPFNPCSPIG